MSSCSSKIELRPLQENEVDIFVAENQRAFDKAVIEEYGPREQSVISRRDIERSLHSEGAKAFRIIADGVPVGGVVVVIHPDTQFNSLDLLFINPDSHSHGIGQTVWKMIEAKYPDTKVWETHTPYFEKRNIHFYVNRCGFHIVEFFNEHHQDPHMVPDSGPCDMPGSENFFRFEKQMKP